MSRARWRFALAAVTLWGGVASAEVAERESRELAVTARAGMGEFTGELGTLTEAGPSWGFTLNLQPYTYLGWELSYDGSANQIALPSADGYLLRHAAAGLVRLNIPFLDRVRPFLAAGVGASYVMPTPGSGEGFRADLVQELPFGGGLEFHTERLTTGLRAIYRPLLGESFASGVREGNPQGGFTDVNLSLGARF